MSQSNGPTAVVGAALNLLHDALKPFVEHELRTRHGDAWAQVARSALPTARATAEDGGDDPFDVAALLQIIEKHWSSVFVGRLGPGDRASVNELRGIRNQWANQRPFAASEVIRALDTTQRLLRGMKRPDEARQVSDLIRGLVPTAGSQASAKSAAVAPSVRSLPPAAVRPPASMPASAGVRAGTWARDLDPLATAFVTVFGPKHQLFGSTALGHLGISDGVAGVQWTADLELASGRATLGVNLEGMQYDGWPVARLIERELAAPEFLSVVAPLPHASEVTLHWRRDGWQAGGRLAIVESDIAPTPITLDRLTSDAWSIALREAYACMDAARGHRGRGKQLVTMSASGERTEKDVSPRLTLVIAVPSGGASASWVSEIESVRARLGGIHDWAAERAAR